ncbi:MAG: hypothetical protein ACON5B_17900 [Myxococcota bacterium]
MWSTMRQVGLGAWLMLMPGTSLAQDDTFSLDTILVATFEAAQPFLAAEADRVEGLVAEALGETYITVRTAEVPPFEGYDAPTYVRACPEGQYIGCVFVVAGKAQTEWAMGGTVKAVDGGYRVTVQVVDVARAVLVAEFDTDMDGDDDVAFKAGVQQIMAAVLAGDLGQLRDEAAERRAAEEAKRQRDAERLADQARAVQAANEESARLERGEVADRLDLELTEAADEVQEPWERAGLTQMQFRRYSALGEKLTTFRTRLEGRKGQILIRVSGQVGAGPWGSKYQADYMVDSASFDPKNPADATITDERLVQVQSGELGLSLGGQLELGVGILPWLEVGAFAGVRYAPFDVRFTRYIYAQEALAAGDLYGGIGWQVGARVGMVGFPAYPVRPSLHVGASYWQGADLESVLTPPSGLDAQGFIQGSNAVLVHVQPGVEFGLGKHVALWSRFDLDVAVAGRLSQKARFQRAVDTELDTASEAYAERYLIPTGIPEPQLDRAPAIGGSVGLLFFAPTKRR